MTANLLRADARDLPLADDSVDLIVTSPPYFALRSYQDGGEHYEGQIGAEATPGEFVDALLEVTREMMRVLKPSGSIFVNLGDKYARSGGGGAGSSDGVLGRGPRPASRATDVRAKSLIGVPWRYTIRCIDDLDLILRAEIIWAKPNGLPESVTDRVSRKHEQWFHFTVSERYYANIDAVREAYSSDLPSRIASGAYSVGAGRNDGDRHGSGGFLSRRVLGKIPGSCWSIPTEPLRVPDTLGVDHYAAFPTAFPARFIRGWSPDDGVVLDPFGGTGTTAAVAKALGRTGISVDLSADYLRIADWRCNGDGHARVVAKVHGTKVARRSQVNDSSAMRLFEDSK